MQNISPVVSPYKRAVGRQLGWVLLLILLRLPLSAQTGPTATPQQAPKTAPEIEQVLPSYEGQTVSSVELAGRPTLDTSELKPLLTLQVGDKFSHARIKESLEALQRTGRFQAVELDIRPDAEGVRVLFVLQPAMYFGVYQFAGALGQFAYSRLLQVADYPPRGAFSHVDVSRAQQSLSRFFQRSGYFQAQVRSELHIDEQHGLVNVTFHTELNKRAKFGDVKINGTSPQQAESLKGKLRSIMARLRGSAIRPGKTYKYRTIERAAQYLNNTLIDRGYLGAEVNLLGAEYDPETNRADVAFNVETGPKVDVDVEGAFLWPWTRDNLLPIYQQAGINPEIVQEGRQNLVSHFQSKGFFNAKVTVDTQMLRDKHSIVYQVEKGERHKVADVNITGNQHFSDQELMPQLAVEDAGWFPPLFSRGKYSQQLVRESVNDMKRLYEVDGFSSVEITPEVKYRGGNLVVTFRVDEGPQDIVESLRIEGNETQPIQQLAPKGLRLATGQPYSQRRVDEDRNRIMARYLQLGYLNATFREALRQVDDNPHRLQVIYNIDEGPRVRIASVVTVGAQNTRQSLINRTLDPGLQTEAPLRQNDMLRSESELYNLGIFDWAQIDPRRTITTQTQEDVVVKVHESKRNAMTYGFGFEVINRGGSVPSGTVAVPGLPPVGLSEEFRTSEKTFYGPRGSFEYTRRNVRGKAETITLTALAGRLNQRGSISYLNPYFRFTKWQSNLTISGEHNSENPIFTSRLAQFSWQLQRPLNPDKTTNLFLRYSFRQTGLTRLLIPELVPPEDQSVRLSTLSLIYLRDTRDNALDAHKGMYQSYSLDFNPRALGSNFNFARLLTQTAYYKGMPLGIVWANSLRLGFEKPFTGHIPVSEKFFTGGGSTLRGFPLNGAGPQRTISACGTTGCFPITVPVGGNQLLIFNSEFRIPVPLKKGLSVVPFYDGGNVFPAIGFHGQYTNTIGAGVRYSTPVGPVRIDVGHNLNAQPGIKSTQIFITLGQAF